jgi:hypothetical protein
MVTSFSASYMMYTIITRNGRGWCLIVPIYVLNWDHLDVHVPEVDDVPPGGNVRILGLWI